MNPFRFSKSFLFVSLVLAAACGGGGGGSPAAGGGGGGGNPNVPSSDPGAYRPELPQGAGVAGPMDGYWQVAAIELTPDARSRNADPEQAWLYVDEVLEFTNGVFVEDQSSDPSEPLPGLSIPVHLDFYVNQYVQGATLYGYGVTIGDNPYIGAGWARAVAFFGTTSATTAVANVVQEDLVAGAAFPGSDMFLVARVHLVKLPGPPASLQASDGAIAAANDSTKPEQAAPPARLVRPQIAMIQR